MDREILRRYARLIARSGVNIQQGQYAVIRTAPEQLDFVEMLAEECYLAGAAKVLIEWRYQPFTRLDIQYQSDEVLGRVESWEEENMKKKTELLPFNGSSILVIPLKFSSFSKSIYINISFHLIFASREEAMGIFFNNILIYYHKFLF